MPRRRKAARAYRDTGALAQRLEKYFANPFNQFHQSPPEFVRTPEDHAAFDAALEEVIKRDLADRYEQRRGTLLARLAEWPPAMWGSIFCEYPDLEEDLTAEQAASWQACLSRETPAGNVLAMP
jgi:hypothetical protein